MIAIAVKATARMVMATVTRISESVGAVWSLLFWVGWVDVCGFVLVVGFVVFVGVVVCVWFWVVVGVAVVFVWFVS